MCIYFIILTIFNKYSWLEITHESHIYLLHGHYSLFTFMFFSENMLHKYSICCLYYLKTITPLISIDRLRNEYNIILIDWGIKQNRWKTAPMRIAHCYRSFPFFFRLIPWSTEKKKLDLPGISYHLILNSFQIVNNHLTPL